MKSIRRIGVCAMLIATVASLSACDTMTTQQRNAAIGAGIGGVAGAAEMIRYRFTQRFTRERSKLASICPTRTTAESP